MSEQADVQAAMKRMFTGARFKQPRDIGEYALLHRNHMLCVCDTQKLPICDMPKCNKTARYDAQLPQGPWGNVCHAHAKDLNVAIGLGRGQGLISKEEHANL